MNAIEVLTTLIKFIDTILKTLYTIFTLKNKLIKEKPPSSTTPNPITEKLNKKHSKDNT